MKKTINSTFFQNFLLVAFALSGASALTYEVVWTRAFSLVIGSSTYAMSTVLAAFMAGLSLGSLIGGYLADKKKDALFCPTCFAFIEIATGFLGLLILPIILRLSPIYAWLYYKFNLSFSQFSLAQLIVVFLILLPPTILMGATFPLVLKARANLKNKPGKEAGSVYAFNTVGAICGSLATGFILIPYVGMLTASVVAAVTNLTVGFATLLITRTRVLAFTSLLILFLFVVIFTFTDSPNPIMFNFYVAGRFTSYNEYLNDTQNVEIMEQKESLYGLVAVARDNLENSFFLIHNGRAEGSTRGDMATQELSALLPLAAKKFKASSILNIGLGTGTTLNAALRAKDVKKVDVVEINPVIKKVALKWFYPEIKKDKRVNFIIADARNYALLSRRKYDIITSEPSYPTEYTSGNLFTKEFFTLVKKKLTPNGVFAQWIPYYLYTPEQIQIAIKTLAQTFPNLEFFFVNDTDIFVLASEKRLPAGFKIKEEAAKHLSPKAQTNNFFYIAESHQTKETAKRNPYLRVNTDLFPILEFAAARNFILNNPAARGVLPTTPTSQLQP